MPNDTHSALIVLTIALVTAAIRYIPFLVFRNSEKIPAYINYLGRVLPYAVMGMLCVYCLKDISFLTAPYAIPEITAVLITVLLTVWKKNSLFSIIGGTVSYMILLAIL